MDVSRGNGKKKSIQVDESLLDWSPMGIKRNSPNTRPEGQSSQGVNVKMAIIKEICDITEKWQEMKVMPKTENIWHFYSSYWLSEVFMDAVFILKFTEYEAH